MGFMGGKAERKVLGGSSSIPRIGDKRSGVGRSYQEVMMRRATSRIGLAICILSTSLLPVLTAGCFGPNDGGPSAPTELTLDQASGTSEGMSTTGVLDIGVVPLTEMEQAEFIRTSLSAEADKTAASRVLNVAFAPQVPPGAWSITMSCGPASLNMDGAFLWHATLDQVRYIRLINQYLHKTDIDNCLPGGTSTTDLVNAARAVNNCPNTYKASGWTLARVRQEIDAGRPVVVAVKAGYLSNRGYSYSGGHFVLVVGYDNGVMVCHDPGTSRGAFKRYSNSDFTSAMAYFGGAVVVPKR